MGKWQSASKAREHPPEIFNIYEADFYPASEVDIPDSVVTREFISLLDRLEEDEKEYFLNILRQYIVMKAKHNSK